jgi:hypothetical protein
VAKISVWSYDVSHSLLQHFRLRKTAIRFSFPDLHSITKDLKSTSCIWLQAHLFNFFTEGMQQFLA